MIYTLKTHKICRKALSIWVNGAFLGAAERVKAPKSGQMDPNTMAILRMIRLTDMED